MCLLQVDWLKRGPGWVRYFEITILTDQDSSGCCGLRILTAEDQPATSDNVAPFNPIPHTASTKVDASVKIRRVTRKKTPLRRKASLSQNSKTKRQMRPSKSSQWRVQMEKENKNSRDDLALKRSLLTPVNVKHQLMISTC